jgi:hypothetical protein
MPAPSGAPTTRTTVGSNEWVTFTTAETATWTFTGGFANGNTTGSEFKWVAPWSGSATITATIAGTPPRTCSIVMTILPPTNMTMVAHRVEPYPIHTGGAGMYTTATFHPLHVSFGRLRWREDVGTRSVKGYFEHYQGIVHVPGAPIPLLASNTAAEDHASSGECPPPWSAGEYTFFIPNYFYCLGRGTEVRSMTTEQHVQMQKDGTVTISKLGANVTRKPTQSTGRSHKGYPSATPGKKGSGKGGRASGGGP